MKPIYFVVVSFKIFISEVVVTVSKADQNTPPPGQAGYDKERHGPITRTDPPARYPQGKIMFRGG